MSVIAALFTAVACGGLMHRLAHARTLARSEPGKLMTRPSDVDATPVEFWASSLAAGVAAFVLVYAATGLVVVSLAPAAVIAGLPRAYYARRRSRQLAALLEAWPDGLRDLVSSVRAGASLPTAIETLGRFGPEPLRSAFSSFGVYARSLGVASALEMIRFDLADPTSDRIIEVLILAHQRGGSVVPTILSDLADATTRDVWALEEIRSEALEQKINSRVVFVLPWLVLVAMTAQSGAFRDFYSTASGLLVVVIGAVMSLGGMYLAARIGRQPDEPRVFLGAPN